MKRPTVLLLGTLALFAFAFALPNTDDVSKSAEELLNSLDAMREAENVAHQTQGKANDFLSMLDVANLANVLKSSSKRGMFNNNDGNSFTSGDILSALNLLQTGDVASNFLGGRDNNINSLNALQSLTQQFPNLGKRGSFNGNSDNVAKMGDILSALNFIKGGDVASSFLGGRDNNLDFLNAVNALNRARGKRGMFNNNDGNSFTSGDILSALNLLQTGDVASNFLGGRDNNVDALNRFNAAQYLRPNAAQVEDIQQIFGKFNNNDGNSFTSGDILSKMSLFNGGDILSKFLGGRDNNIDALNNFNLVNLAKQTIPTDFAQKRDLEDFEGFFKTLLVLQKLKTVAKENDVSQFIKGMLGKGTVISVESDQSFQLFEDKLANVIFGYNDAPIADFIGSQKALTDIMKKIEADVYAFSFKSTKDVTVKITRKISLSIGLPTGLESAFTNGNANIAGRAHIGFEITAEAGFEGEVETTMISPVMDITKATFGRTFGLFKFDEVNNAWERVISRLDAATNRMISYLPKKSVGSYAFVTLDI